MRQNLINFVQNSMLFRYCLPHGDIQKSIYTTIDNDYCYTVSNDNDLATIIFNAIIDYAFNEEDLNGDLNQLQVEAISQRMRIEENDSDETQLKYGFFGEVLLNIILQILFNSKAIIAKGYFYDKLKPEENKGFDTWHFVSTEKGTSLWFGEVKFHQDYKKAIDDVFKNIEKAISDDYFRKNLLAFTPKRKLLNTDNKTIVELIEKVRLNAKVSIESLKNEFSLRLVYPIFILCNPLSDYDKTISSIIDRIKQKHSGKNLNIGLEYDLFFILLPVNNVKQIKQTVLQWIKSNTQLTLL